MRKGLALLCAAALAVGLLCIGAGRENVADIGARLDMDFRTRSGGRGGVICSLLDDGNIW